MQKNITKYSTKIKVVPKKNNMNYLEKKRLLKKWGYRIELSEMTEQKSNSFMSTFDLPLSDHVFTSKILSGFNVSPLDMRITKAWEKLKTPQGGYHYKDLIYLIFRKRFTQTEIAEIYGYKSRQTVISHEKKAVNKLFNSLEYKI